MQDTRQSTQATDFDQQVLEPVETTHLLKLQSEALIKRALIRIQQTAVEDRNCADLINKGRRG